MSIVPQLRMDSRRRVAIVLKKLEATAVAGYVFRGLWAMTRRIIPTNFWQARHIFVVGCGHSGTSITLSLLDNHSRVRAIRVESGFFKKSIIGRIITVRQWVQSWDEHSVLAEKTPEHVHETEEIRSLFPNSVIVAVIRNPLDTIASLKRRYGEIRHCIDRYRRDSEALLSAISAKRVSIVVRYEDLIEQPVDVCRNVLTRANLVFETEVVTDRPAKRQWYSTITDGKPPRYTAQSHNAYRNWQINQPLFDGRGRYTQVLNDGEISMIHDELASIAVKLGYDSATLCPTRIMENGV